MAGNLGNGTFQFMCECMEAQFDGVVEDRPLILSTFELLQNNVSDIPALSWDFFLRRFNTLISESQYEASQGRSPFFPATAAASSESAAVNADVSRDGKLDKAKATREKLGPIVLQSVSEHLRHKIGKVDLTRAVSSPGSVFAATPGTAASTTGGAVSGIPHPIGAKFEALSQMADSLRQCNVHCHVLENQEDNSKLGSATSATSLYAKSCTDVDKETVHILISLLMKV